MSSRRDKVLAFLAEQDGASFDGSVSDLAADMDDPSPGALSATISVLVKEGVLGREPDGQGVVATRLWLRQEDEAPRDTPRAPDPEPEVERCPHGVPLEAAAKLCTTCKAAERQRSSRAARRAPAAPAASEPVEEPEAPELEPHVCGPECTGSPTHLDEPEHDGALPSDGPVDPRTIELDDEPEHVLLPHPGERGGGSLDALEPELEPELEHDDKGHSEERCTRCGWVMGSPPLNCMNDDTPHVFPSQLVAPSVELQEGRQRPQLAVHPVGRLTAEVLVELCDNAGCLSLRIDTPWPLDPSEGELVAGLMERVGAYYAERARMEGR